MMGAERGGRSVVRGQSVARGPEHGEGERGRFPNCKTGLLMHNVSMGRGWREGFHMVFLKFT